MPSLFDLSSFVKSKLKRKNTQKHYPSIHVGALTKSPGMLYEIHQGQPCLVDLPLKHCRWKGASAVSYSTDSLHPYIRTLKQLDANQDKLRYEASELKRYWDTWTPSSLAEMFGITKDQAHPLLGSCPPVHGILPWSDVKAIKTLKRYTKKPEQNNYSPAVSCGPQKERTAKRRFNKIIKLYRFIKQNGYRRKAPSNIPYQDQHILASCLVREDEYRFIINNGKHRAAVLAVLGCTHAPAILFTEANHKRSFVNRSEADGWPLVEAGIFTQQQALMIFDWIFDGIPPDKIQALYR